jgi:hypothetical protein
MNAQDLINQLEQLADKAESLLKVSFWGIGPNYNVSACKLSPYKTEIHLTLSDQGISGKQILESLQNIVLENDAKVLENTVYLTNRVYCSTIVSAVLYNPLDDYIYLMVKMEHES